MPGPRDQDAWPLPGGGLNERRVFLPHTAVHDARTNAHLEYAHTLDPGEWSLRHDRGEVPSRLPYGLDLLEESGVQLTVSERSSARRGTLGRLGGRGGRALLRGVEPPLLRRERELRRRADLVVCWDERTGATAAARSLLRGEPPTATGVIWATEETRPARHLAPCLRSAGAVWALSSAQLDVLAGWGVPQERLHHLLMGIDAGFWRPQAEPAVEPDLVLAVGNDRHRDHAAVVAAVAEAARRRPARLRLVTHHPVEVPAELGERIPHCDHSELRGHYARAAVVALALTPNLHLSGLTALLESMACGKAVVVTRSPGIEDYVRDGETGVLVDPGAAPLADAVGRLLDEPERAAELGASARRDVLARMTTGHQARALAGILETARR
jgi:glycosyltransferase involved in cell wall biosynthesis